MTPYIIIQGHTKYTDFMIDQYKNIENVIWSTDENSFPNDLKKIKNSNITLVTIPTMYGGFGNINLQATSTYIGLCKAKELGATRAIKIRSDMYISPLEKFIGLMVDDEKLYHLGYVNHYGGIYIPKREKETDAWIKKHNYNLKNMSTYNYVIDFMNYGNIENMLLFWDCPFETTKVTVNATHKLIFNYLTKKGVPIDLSFEYLSKYFGFLFTFARKNNIHFRSLKRGYDFSTLGIGETEKAYLG